MNIPCGVGNSPEPRPDNFLAVLIYLTERNRPESRQPCGKGETADAGE
jgi:hypothetical protein